ncbi:MAG: hypothetical protein HZC37_16270 [Burkholderiales bacterium]|nr:hypothetical protein [Burkholderiales bacterium]
MNNPDYDKPEFSDSDRQWLEALRGEGVDPASPAAREGFALRAALERRRLEMEARTEPRAEKSDEARQAQLDKLLQRARAEGAFEREQPDSAVLPAPAPPQSNVIEFPWWRRRRVLVALAASAVIGAVLVTQIVDRPDYGAPPEMLGHANVQKLKATQPRVAAERMAEQLRAAGFRPGLYQRGNTYVVDIQLMAAEIAVAGPAFEALGIKASAGFNRVEIAPA